MSLSKKILYVQYTNPTAYPPLEHGSRILAEDGWDVVFKGSRSRGDSNALQFAGHENIRLELMDYCPPGVWQKLHYARYALWCWGHCLRYRPQVVYASDAWSYPIAWSLSYLPGVQVVMHEHDTPNVQRGRVNRLIGFFRRRLAKRALVCVCPQPQRAEKFREALQPKRLQVVFNCPSRREIGEAFDKPTDELRLWFHGSIVPTQLPMVVLEAMRLCQFPVRLSFAGYETIGHPGYVQQLLDRANELGLGDRVHYLGAIPTRQAMYAAAAQQHVGLALFAMQFREPMVGASNKPFDYLACGLTLLASATPEWEEFFISKGCGISCNSEDPEAISQALLQLWSKPERIHHQARNGQQMLCNLWNYEHQFEPIRCLIGTTL